LEDVASPEHSAPWTIVAITIVLLDVIQLDCGTVLQARFAKMESAWEPLDQLVPTLEIAILARAAIALLHNLRECVVERMQNWVAMKHRLESTLAGTTA